MREVTVFLQIGQTLKHPGSKKPSHTIKKLVDEDKVVPDRIFIERSSKIRLEKSHCLEHMILLQVNSLQHITLNMLITKNGVRGDHGFSNTRMGGGQLKGQKPTHKLQLVLTAHSVCAHWNPLKDPQNNWSLH